MLLFEKKICEWINRHLTYIAFVFVGVAAIWIRMGGRKYVVNDCHFSLYDLPGNCNSILYRSLVGVLLRSEDVVALIKLLAYVGDFAVAFLAAALLYRKRQKISDLRTFLIVTACLLSPVVLIYGVSGMRIDSVCMAMLLFSLLLFRGNRLSAAATVLAFAAFLLPAYWPVAVAFLAYMLIKRGKENGFTAQAGVAAAWMALCLAASFWLENRGGGYFWGKVFVINPATGENYADPGQWLLGMCRIYGYFFATGSLLLALKYKKFRIPALVLQIIVVMYMGWQQTSAWAI